jgi:hypothetical protein
MVFQNIMPQTLDKNSAAVRAVRVLAFIVKNIADIAILDSRGERDPARSLERKSDSGGYTLLYRSSGCRWREESG